jgi:hypothetical protein
MEMITQVKTYLDRKGVEYVEETADCFIIKLTLYNVNGEKIKAMISDYEEGELTLDDLTNGEMIDMYADHKKLNRFLGKHTV